ncbi:MAG: hypothetical protein LBQ58_01665 [Synergistaceae bacterium]|nr:hypothetical protein [Synergistaceae bacterium]
MESFYRDLYSREVRKILMSSRRAFFKDPGVFLKCLLLYAFPRRYYEYRSKHMYGRSVE